VARRHLDDRGGVVEGDRERVFELAAQRCELRREPCLRLPLGPEQLGAERRQRGALALAPDEQLPAELAFPALELALDVAVRAADVARRGRDRALRLDRVEHLDQRMVELAWRAVGCVQRVRELDPMHASSYRRPRR